MTWGEMTVPDCGDSVGNDGLSPMAGTAWDSAHSMTTKTQVSKGIDLSPMFGTGRDRVTRVTCPRLPLPMGGTGRDTATFHHTLEGMTQ